jgi:hypothetical protein
MGEAKGMFSKLLREGYVADAIDLLEEALDNYNSVSPYIRLHEFIGNPCCVCGQNTGLREAYRGTKDNLVRVAICDNCCQFSCNHCAVRYHAEVDGAVTGYGCTKCTTTCPKCEVIVRRDGIRVDGCIKCMPKCSKCHKCKAATGTWYLLKARDFTRLLCGPCFRMTSEWPGANTTITPFDMSTCPFTTIRFRMADWLGAGNNSLGHIELPTLWMERFKAARKRVVEAPIPHPMPQRHALSYSRMSTSTSTAFPTITTLWETDSG